ncbi:sigma-54-dependent Fis family transcriptional regulator [bacterium]|nr:sigma-54-dependent Fis family transcriptional regulator [bacterium]
MHILLVEDNPAIRESLNDLLNNMNYTVTCCENGREAIDLLQGTAVDVVISDIMMPEVDGHRLLMKIKQNESLKHIEVVLFTGHGDIKSAVEAMRQGAYDYLLKPVDVQELGLVLKRIQELVLLKTEHRRLSQHFQEEVQKATKTIENELIAVRKAFAREIGTIEIGIFSDSMKQLFKRAETLHQNPEIPILIEGETGTGKELVAHFIHYGFGDVISPFVGLNCAALSASLFESELFGYEPGAFTGGNPKGQIGKLELAKNGSLFLDEITEMPAEHQAKLLRVIQEREFFRVGGLKKQQAEARFICATNQNVKNAISDGKFRQDLYFRLNIGHVRIPPLRERREEILPLALLFLNRLSNQRPTHFSKIHPDASSLLKNYQWPGNVRELKNLIERIVLYWDDEEIRPVHVRACLESIPSLQPTETSLEPAEDLHLPGSGLQLNDHILAIVKKALQRHGGNQTQTARYLGISVRVLQTYLKKIKK